MYGQAKKAKQQRMAAVQGAGAASTGGGGVPGTGMSAKQQKLFELRMRMVGDLVCLLVAREAATCARVRCCGARETNFGTV